MWSRCGHTAKVVSATILLISLISLLAVTYISEDVSADRNSINDRYIQSPYAEDEAILADVTGSGVFRMPETVVLDGKQLLVTSIGPNVFNDSTVTTVIISDTVREIDSHAFDNCPTLKYINVTDNDKFGSYDGVLFDSAFSTLVRCPEGKSGSYHIPSGVTTIFDRAFFNCKGITEIRDSGGVITIGDHSFANSGLKSANLPLGILTIGDYAFYGCHDIRSIFIPWSVLSIGQGVFSYCTSVDYIYVQPSNPNYSSVDGVLCNKSGDMIINVPGNYEGSFVIPDSVNIVLEMSFSGCTKLETIEIGKSITYLDPYIFDGCDSLRYLKVDPENTVYRSENGVLLTDEGRELVFIPKAMEGTLTVPEGVTHIDETIFLGGSKLTEIKLPSTYSDIGWNFYEFAFDLKSIEVDPENPVFESIDGCLYYRTGILLAVPPSKTGELVIPSGTTGIENDALNSCIYIDSIVIPSTVDNLSVFIFFGCKSLQKIIISPDNPGYASVDGVLFDKDVKELISYPNGKVGGYRIPDGVVTVKMMAFSSCIIDRIYIPASVTSIEDMAFYGCSSLKYIEFAGNPELGYSSFDLGAYVGEDVRCIVVCPENPDIMSSQMGIIAVEPERDYGKRAEYAPIVAIVCICLVETTLIEAVYRKR